MNRKNNKHKTAAFKKEENHNEELYREVAEGWIAFCKESQSQKARDGFSLKLDRALQNRLPDWTEFGMLRGRENELRQSAHLLLIQRYLAGNARLVSATADSDAKEVANQLQRSVHASVYAATRKLLRSIQRDIRWNEYFANFEDVPQAACIHPALRRDWTELPFDLQRPLVFVALEQALREKLLAPQNIEIARVIAEEGIPQAEIARRMLISRQAVCQRLAPLLKYLREYLDQTEFPNE